MQNQSSLGLLSKDRQHTPVSVTHTPGLGDNFTALHLSKTISVSGAVGIQTPMPLDSGGLIAHNGGIDSLLANTR